MAGVFDGMLSSSAWCLVAPDVRCIVVNSRHGHVPLADAGMRIPWLTGGMKHPGCHTGSLVEAAAAPPGADVAGDLSGSWAALLWSFAATAAYTLVRTHTQRLLLLWNMHAVRACTCAVHVESVGTADAPLTDTRTHVRTYRQLAWSQHSSPSPLPRGWACPHSQPGAGSLVSQLAT